MGSGHQVSCNLAKPTCSYYGDKVTRKDEKEEHYVIRHQERHSDPIISVVHSENESLRKTHRLAMQRANEMQTILEGYVIQDNSIKNGKD